jgi:hypothetical protein
MKERGRELLSGPMILVSLKVKYLKYNLIIYDKNNHPVVTKNLLAKNAADTQSIVFPAAQIYHMQVQVIGLLKPGQTPDFTCNGVATGYVVVPEFPLGVVPYLLVATFLAVLIACQRRVKNKN